MSGKTLMIQGCASSVGKSLIVTGLCRLFRRRGFSVAPFKALNMSLNSAVTKCGGEIGRAQAVQAEAAGIDATVEMNPVLLKPEAGGSTQVIVSGKAFAQMDPSDYHARHRSLSNVVEASLNTLRELFDLVIIEGAGSPAEINLRSRDIANMHVALLANSPVLLVGDIDRGGVFAHLVGTLELLKQKERDLIAGFVINKFRGDASLLDSGIRALEERTNVPVVGVMPWVRDLRIPDEDSVSLEQHAPASTASNESFIAVIRLPHISNFDDFLALDHEPGVLLKYVETAAELASADLVILPGSKDTRSDLKWLRSAGIDAVLAQRAEAGQFVLGICGGYQMLGEVIEDPDGAEGEPGEMKGLSLLPVRTRFQSQKITKRVEARPTLNAACFLTSKLTAPIKIDAYEIHMGQVQAADETPGLFAFHDGTQEGKIKGSVAGTLLHGIFENNDLRAALLTELRDGQPPSSSTDQIATFEAEYDRLADTLEQSLNIEQIEAAFRG